MAAPIYDTDLQDITLCETTTGFSALGGGQSGLGAGTDFAIQGTNAVDKQVNGALKGMVYDFGSTITLGADDHIFIWEVCATPGITDIKSNGGIRNTIGTATNAYYEWYVNGSDTLPEGGMKNYVVYYTGSTAQNTVGSPGAAPRWFGGQANVTGTAKGVNFALDAMRYGTGLYITEGDETTPITFSSSAAVNDQSANRYGIITTVPGGTAMKGRLVIGQDSNQVPTASYFVANNAAITFLETEYAKDDFTQVIFDHPSTQVFINNSTFTGIAGTNPGQIRFLDASTTGSIVDSTFKRTGTVTLQPNVQVTGSVFSECRNVVQSGSAIFDSTFIGTFSTQSAETTASLVSDDPSLITFNSFVGDGTHFGMQIIVTGSYTLQSNTFTDFVSGSVSGAAILFDPPGGTGDLELNIAGGVASPSFINLSSGTVTINNNIGITLTGLKDNTEVRVMENGTNPPVELAGIENATSGSTDDRFFEFFLPAGTIVDINIVNLQYVIQRISPYTIPSSDAQIPIQQVFDRNYI